MIPEIPGTQMEETSKSSSDSDDVAQSRREALQFLFKAGNDERYNSLIDNNCFHFLASFSPVSPKYFSTEPTGLGLAAGIAPAASNAAAPVCPKRGEDYLYDDAVSNPRMVHHIRC
jgi:hypothetical protein